ncbi:pentapeptide repeat-containing protein [Streptosporangium roseum]|uniref:pentapeptide repeat-containing protein n=1 Tax=Streptosporangium roseum TaxID=2001 RepID=UPI000690D4D2|nr:pentapeptide repeat-containing protein [Streptosporangium roseum]
MWIVPAALLVGGTVTAVAWRLLGSLPALPKTAEEVTARQGAPQLALGAGAGIGAVITVMLAFRRQRHQELTALITSRQADRSAEHNRQNAIERRATELHAKAVEQLSHASAAVRLGGLYALERLAQDNPGHRQMIVNVIRAYLRMPYTLPPAPVLVVDRSEALRAARRRHHALRVAARGRATPPPATIGAAGAGGDTEGERQVRRTAQRILAEHLRDRRTPEQREAEPADARFWPDTYIDLTGTTLIDLDVTSCHLTRADFRGATFTGGVGFSEAIVVGSDTGHSWPAGWAVVVQPDGTGRLKQVSKTTTANGAPGG